MKIDDLVTYLTTNLNAFITAQSLATITAGQIITRNFIEPQQPVTLFLDPQPEEIEPLTMLRVLVTFRVEAYFFVMRSAVESVARESTKKYLTALLNCMNAHPDYFTFEDRDYFDGVEGKQDIKASKVTLVFKFEE